MEEKQNVTLKSFSHPKSKQQYSLVELVPKENGIYEERKNGNQRTIYQMSTNSQASTEPGESNKTLGLPIVKIKKNLINTR